MPDEDREACIQLADELRELARTLVERRVDADAARAARAIVSRARPYLAGPLRPRWYESDEPRAFWQESEGLSEVSEVSETQNAFDALSPVRGRLNAVAPPLRLHVAERADGSRYIAGHARLSSLYEGPPRGVHGGIVAALFDEILGASMALAPPPGVTAKLEVDYRHLTPIEEDLRLEAWIVEERDRRLHASATCHAGETLTATARALFVRVDFKQVEARMRARNVD